MALPRVAVAVLPARQAQSCAAACACISCMAACAAEVPFALAKHVACKPGALL